METAKELGIIDERDEAGWESWIEDATKHDIEWLRELAIQHLAQQADVERLEAELEKEREFRLGHWSIDDAVEALESVEADRSELNTELEKARELLSEASTAITTGAGEYGLLERMATFLEGSK